MQAAEAADAATAQVVGKKQLCALLRWSRPTLDSRLDRDPAFPILTRGGKGGGWEFDVAAVRRYLSGASAARTDDLDDQDEPEETAEVLAFRPAGQTTQTRGEETASARVKNAQAALAEDKLRRSRGDLVEASAVSAVLGELFVQLRAEMLNIPDSVGRDLDLSDRAVALMKRQVENALRNSARTIKQKLAETTHPAAVADV